MHGEYRGNIREVGQMIQYPKQIRSHIPAPHSSSLPRRCDAAVKPQHRLCAAQPTTCHMHCVKWDAMHRAWRDDG